MKRLNLNKRQEVERHSIPDQDKKVGVHHALGNTQVDWFDWSKVS